jgi:hypothetical protein
MSKTRSRFFLLATLMVLLAVSERGLAHPAVPQTPVLGSYISVWTDTVPSFDSQVAYNSRHDEYLVVWVDMKGMTWDIHARRIGGDGVPSSHFVVVHHENRHNYEPAVAYSPEHDEYLIAYTYDSLTPDSDVWARRVKWDGSWMSGEIHIRAEVDDQHRPAVAYNGQMDEYLVVYQNTWAGGLEDIAAQRVRASDGGLESWRNLATAPPAKPGEKRSDPSVAYNVARNEYLITYSYRPTSIYDPADVRGKVTSGTMGDLSDEIHICDTSVSQEWPAVTAGPDEYLVTWVNRFTGDAADDIYARRVSGDGAPEGPTEGFVVAEGTGYQIFSDVDYGAGYGYLFVWRHVPAGTIGVWDVHGRYMMPSHDCPTGEAFQVSDTESFDTGVRVACAPSGSCMVAMDNIFSGTDLDIQGRMVSPHRVHLPLVVNN